MSEAARRVFLCHASADAAAAGRLVTGLETGGAVCWISGRDVAPGENFQEAIVRAIRDARAVVLLLTEAANRSTEVRKELALASSFLVPVLPVRVGAVEPVEALRYELATRQWIDAADADAAVPALRAALGDQAPIVTAVGPEAPALALPDKPSLVVLPFVNLSGDPEQEYFADGLVEDITTALSCIRSLFVIARNSAFSYKGKSQDVRQVGRDLGVRYVLEGSVRRAGSRVRITGQLVDATTGAHVWANRFDGALDDVFDLQDGITASVVGAIQPNLERAEIERAQRKPTQDLGAYDVFLRGMALYHTAESAMIRDAYDLFARAFAQDANYGAAHAMAAVCIQWLAANGYLTASAEERAEGVRLARLATVTGKDDAAALANAGMVLAWMARDFDAGSLLTERACGLNPNSALAWSMAGWVKVYSSEPATALESFERAIRLSPVDPTKYLFLTGMAFAHFTAGRYRESEEVAARAASEQPSYSAAHRIRSASLAMAGRMEDARRAMDEMLRLEPQMRLSDTSAWMSPFRRPDDTARYTEGLRLAGMPE